MGSSAGWRRSVELDRQSNPDRWDNVAASNDVLLGFHFIYFLFFLFNIGPDNCSVLAHEWAILSVYQLDSSTVE